MIGYNLIREIWSADKPPIDQSVFIFSIDRQILIEHQISLFWNQRACPNWKMDCKNQIDCKK